MDYYRRTKIFPIMHTVVIRRDLHEQHPFVATSLFRALNEAKASPRRRSIIRARCATCCRGCWPRSTRSRRCSAAIRWPYGVEANRPTLDALVRYLEEQGVIAKAPRVDDLFVPIRVRH